MKKRRITYQQQQEIAGYRLTNMQQAIYNSLLQYQHIKPQLTEPQYRLFTTLFIDIKRQNKRALQFHGKTRNT